METSNGGANGASGASELDPETFAVAEQAAWWLQRLERATPQERVTFLDWARQSPKHVREILLALTIEESLRDLARHDDGLLIARLGLASPVA